MSETPNTPGIGGYAAAVLIAFAWNSVFLAVIGLGDGPALFMSLLVAAFLYQCMLGPFVAVPGVLLVHLGLRRVRWQWLHVVASAAAGAGAGLLLQLLLGAWEGLTLSMAVACGLGRLSLVPEVERRRRRLASGTPIQVT